MTPESAIASLDNTIAQHGQSVRLVRMDGKTAQVLCQANLSAIVRGYSSTTALAGTNQIQGDTVVTVSPTDLDREGWPTANPGIYPPIDDDPRIPRRGDRIVINGRQRNVESAEPFYINDKLVRINVTVRGG
jgi:hypothetical protein